MTAGGVADSVDHGGGLGRRMDRPEFRIWCVGDSSDWRRYRTTANGTVELSVRFQHDTWAYWDGPCDSARRAAFGDSTRVRRGDLAGYAFLDRDASVTCDWDSSGKLLSLSAVGDEMGLPYWLWTEARGESAGVRMLWLKLARAAPGGFPMPDQGSLAGNYREGPSDVDTTLARVGCR